MNLLTHLYLADHTDTSFAGQILGDVVKGRLGKRYSPRVRAGIRLHRAIDRFSDDHPQHGAMRRMFDPPLRRYAGILVDIGFDYSLARAWADHDERPLADFAAHAEQRVHAEWPDEAPFAATRLAGLEHVLTGYRAPQGIQRALTSVSNRLSRNNPLDGAGPAVLALSDEFDVRLEALLGALRSFADQTAQKDRRNPDMNTYGC